MAADEIAGPGHARRMLVPCMRGMLLPLLLLSIASVAGIAASPRTMLEIRLVETPRHDGRAGRSLIRLIARVDSSVVSHDTLEGVWYQIGYDSASGRYLLGGAFEIGAWLPIRSLGYLDERTGHITWSRFGNEGWFAMAMIARSDGRFIAFVGARKDDATMRLALLDTRGDSIAVAGRAPGPPPLADENEREYFRESGSRYEWGTPPWDGFVGLDAGVITFEGSDGLVARYGADSETHRSKRRSVRRWSIAKLFPK